MTTAAISMALIRRAINAALTPFLASLLIVTFCLSASSQTPSETREQLLKDLDSGQLRDAVLVGQQAVSRWPRDSEFRHYLGVAYFKTGDIKQAQDQLSRARELNPKDSAIRFDLALVLLSQENYPAAADELEPPPGSTLQTLSLTSFSDAPT